MRIFLASSMESKDIMDSIAVWIADSGHEAVKWERSRACSAGHAEFRNAYQHHRRG